MRKRGNQHSRLAVVPLCVKGNKYALNAHVALLALRNDVAKESHLVDLYTLAALCEELVKNEQHIHAHCGAVRRLCGEIHSDGYRCQELRYAAMEVSANILLEWFERRKNVDVWRTATRMAARLAA